MSEQNSGAPQGGLQGPKLTEFLMQGQEPAEAEQPAAGFTGPPKSVTEAQADAQADDDGPINAQQESVQEESVLAEEAGERGVLDALPEAKGQRDKPFALTDLPEDRYIEIKIDGAKEVVSLRELASGHIRRRAFNKFANTANAAADEALEIARASVEAQKRVYDERDALFGTPKHLFDYMMERHPEALEKVARAYAAVWENWEKNPDARRHYEWTRQQRQIAAERQRFQQEKAQHEKQVTETKAAQAELERLKPTMQRVMRELGFPKVTPKFRETVNILCEAARRTNGGKLDADDLRDALYQAHKLHPAESPVQERRPAPAPIAPPKPRAPNGRPGNGKTDWSQVSYARKMSDPDFFLRR